MRNFALFLLLGNVVWWSWQFFFHGNELSVAQEIQHASFVQADARLQMFGGVPLGLPAENFDQNKAGEDTAVSPVVEVSPQVATIPPEPWCGVTKSISSPERIKNFQTEWLKKAGEAEQESVKEPGSSTWWVYLPFKDEPAAQVVLKQLHDKEIDSYYMRSGELAGGISLGVFSRKESAVNIREDVRKKGYPAEVKEFLRLETKYRLALKLSDREKIQDPIVKEFLVKYGDIQLKEIACK